MTLERYAHDPQAPSTQLLDALARTARFQAPQGDPRDIDVDLLRVDDIMVTRVSGTRGSLQWPTESRYLFLFVTQGQVTLELPAERSSSSNGAIQVILPGPGPATISFDQPTRAIGFSFDKNLHPTAHASTSQIEVLHPNAMVFRTTYALLQTLLDARDRKERELAGAIRSLLEGSAKGLLDVLYPRSGTLTERAMRIISAQHTHPDLDVQSIANLLGVSTTTLSRAFTETGSSVSARLRAQRTTTAITLRTRNPHLTLEELRLLSGFGSADSLRRALRNTRTTENTP